jgi:AAA15 family ATPase/GTPase
VKANHPTNPQCADLLQKKVSELKKIVEDNSITCADKTKNAVMRSSIWNHNSADLQLSEIEIDVTKGDTKSIWDKLQNYLPLYSLFQSDRKNSDGDSEVQDPLKEAVKQILSNEEIKNKFDEIAREVETKLKEVSTRTLEKIKEMNPSIANSLNPIIPSSESLKWTDVFKTVSISGDDDIPINKRGSGVKRLVLLNFFRAEAERRKEEQEIPSIIYAIEEPETSQHTEHQKMLIKSLLDLSKSQNTQIIITTHSASLVKELNFENIRLVAYNNESKSIIKISEKYLPYSSVNEVNYLAFEEITEEYHNELYGFIESEGWWNEYKNGKSTMNYIKIKSDESQNTVQVILTEYIRHQIHHPENTKNTRFTFENLKDSVNLMTQYIQSKKAAN